MTKDSHDLSIWFFVGVMLSVYGVLIVAAGIHEWIWPPEVPVKLAYLHANIWWGGILLILGLFYLLHFGPEREKIVRQFS